ncbi:MAG: helix-turn-helix transcriptional regulator [Clostridiales bacterium]|nr:helix-turn-helix transcriptional regulator [Clostridiales bacterium]
MKERIKKLRKALGLTQQEFADKIGTAQNNIAGYETGKRSPSAAVISLICKTFNVSEAWLRTGDGGMFDTENNDTLGAFIRERNLTTTDRILIEKFVSLSVKARWEVVKFVLDIADALWEESKASSQQRTELDTDIEQGSDVAHTTTKLHIAARDGSRMEVEVDGELTLPEEDSKLPR